MPRLVASARENCKIKVIKVCDKCHFIHIHVEWKDSSSASQKMGRQLFLSTRCFIKRRVVVPWSLSKLSAGELGEARWCNLDRRPLHHRDNHTHTQIQFCTILTLVNSIERHVFQPQEETAGIRENSWRACKVEDKVRSSGRHQPPKQKCSSI